MLINVDLNENNTPIIVGYYKFNTGWKYYTNHDKGLITVINPSGDRWTFKDNQIKEVLMLLIGKTEIEEIRENYNKIKSKSKYNRFLYKNIIKIIRLLKKLVNWLNN